MFVLFDSFTGLIPREVTLEAINGEIARRNSKSRETEDSRRMQPVMDFISLAGIDVNHMTALGDDDRALGNYLRKKSAEITGDFVTYWKQKTGGNEVVQLRAKHRRDASGVSKLAFFVSDGANDQYAEQRSQGFRWFLSFYLRLAAAKRETSGPDRVLLIDEPGTYLHARAQKDVLPLFEDRIATGADRVIYSTHSPYLLSADSRLHRIRIVAKTAAHGTRVYDRLTHPDLRGTDSLETLSPIINAIGLDVRDALSFTREQNILVEGISDRLYLQAWSRLWMPTFVDEFNIFPGTGGNTLTSLAAMFTGWGLPFVVILDGDKNGRDERKKLITNLLMQEDRIVHPGVGTSTSNESIEDSFSSDDFGRLLKALDVALEVQTGESPSAAIKRLKVDKVLVARTFAEAPGELLALRSHQGSSAWAS